MLLDCVRYYMRYITNDYYFVIHEGVNRETIGLVQRGWANIYYSCEQNKSVFSLVRHL